MKAQFTPLGAILIVAMVVSLISLAFVWSDMMIEKQKMIVDYTYAENKMAEMRDAVWVVSHGMGRQEAVDVNLERVWMSVVEGWPYERDGEGYRITGNYIDLVMDIDVDILEQGAWIGLKPEGEIERFGLLGRDGMGVILGRNYGEKTVLRLWYRDLFDADAKRYYRVRLLKEKPWKLESDKQRLVFTNTGEEKEGSYIVTNVTISVR